MFIRVKRFQAFKVFSIYRRLRDITLGRYLWYFIGTISYLFFAIVDWTDRFSYINYVNHVWFSILIGKMWWYCRYTYILYINMTFYDDVTAELIMNTKSEKSVVALCWITAENLAGRKTSRWRLESDEAPLRCKLWIEMKPLRNFSLDHLFFVEILHLPQICPVADHTQCQVLLPQFSRIRWFS